MIIFILKVILKFGLGLIGAAAFVIAVMEALLFAGFVDANDISWELSFGYFFSVAIVIALLVYLVCKLFSWDKALRVILGGMAWMVVAGMIGFFVFAAIMAQTGDLRISKSVGEAITGIAIILAVGLLVYVPLVEFILGYLGTKFKLLANAQPGGRTVLLREVVNSAYSKPQVRAFANELDAEGSSGGGMLVPTTVILYVAPFAVIAIVFAG